MDNYDDPLGIPDIHDMWLLGLLGVLLLAAVVIAVLLGCYF